MPLSGHWNGTALPRLDSYGGASKWGDGASPVFSRRGGPGRGTAPGGSDGSEPSPLTLTETHDDYADILDQGGIGIWGYSMQDGTAERPGWDQDTPRSSADGFPSYGPKTGGRPGGDNIRSINKGADLTNMQKVDPGEDAATAGWENKLTGAVEDSQVADDSQLYMQTSMVQRDKTRAGSQRGGGSASTYDAPIKSRIPGQRAPKYSGGFRHRDMEPRTQTGFLRPFLGRIAGTGNPRDMMPNEMYVSRPLQRAIPPDPNLGPEIAGNTDGYTNSYGFTGEDMGAWF